MRRLGVEDRVQLLQGIFPEDTGPVGRGHEFRLVHVDVDVYQSCVDVFEWAWPRLSAGGAVVFDDYGCPATPGVTKFVDGLKGMQDRIARAQPQRPRDPVQALRKRRGLGQRVGRADLVEALGGLVAGELAARATARA